LPTRRLKASPGKGECAIIPIEQSEAETPNSTWHHNSTWHNSAPSSAALLVVSTAGSDVAGDGSVALPYATLTRCITAHKHPHLAPPVLNPSETHLQITNGKGKAVWQQAFPLLDACCVGDTTGNRWLMFQALVELQIRRSSLQRTTVMGSLQSCLMALPHSKGYNGSSSTMGVYGLQWSRLLLRARVYTNCLLTGLCGLPHGGMAIASAPWILPPPKSKQTYHV
jgi:hypothetical protein